MLESVEELEDSESDSSEISWPRFMAQAFLQEPASVLSFNSESILSIVF
jgi:hypothetical protein